MVGEYSWQLVNKHLSVELALRDREMAGILVAGKPNTNDRLLCYISWLAHSAVGPSQRSMNYDACMVYNCVFSFTAFNVQQIKLFGNLGRMVHNINRMRRVHL